MPSNSQRTGNPVPALALPTEVMLRLCRLRRALAISTDLLDKEHADREEQVEIWKHTTIAAIQNCDSLTAPKSAQVASDWLVALGKLDSGVGEKDLCFQLFSDSVLFFVGNAARRRDCVRSVLASLIKQDKRNTLGLALIDPLRQGADIGRLDLFHKWDGDSYVVECQTRVTTSHNKDDSKQRSEEHTLPTAFFESLLVRTHEPESSRASHCTVALIRGNTALIKCLLRDERLLEMTRQRLLQIIVEGEPASAFSVQRTLSGAGLCPVIFDLSSQDGPVLHVGGSALASGLSVAMMPKETYDSVLKEARTARTAPTEWKLDAVALTATAPSETERKQGVAVPIGIDAHREYINFQLDEGDHPHALIVGTSGSGKSTLLKTILTGLVARYRADEVDLRIFDLKGTEFVELAIWPHVRQLVRSGDPETCAAVLLSAQYEIERRRALFQADRAKDLSAFNSQALKLPRVIFVLDEFQQLFTASTELARLAKALFETCLKQGRSFGVHLVFATQSLDSVGGFGVSDLLVNSVQNRLLMLMDQADFRRFCQLGDVDSGIAPQKKGDCLLIGLNRNAKTRFQFGLIDAAFEQQLAPVSPAHFDPKSFHINGLRLSRPGFSAQQESQLGVDSVSGEDMYFDGAYFAANTLVVCSDDGAGEQEWLRHFFQTLPVQGTRFVLSEGRSNPFLREDGGSFDGCSVEEFESGAYSNTLFVFLDDLVDGLTSRLSEDVSTFKRVETQWDALLKPGVSKGNRGLFVVRSAKAFARKHRASFDNRVWVVSSPSRFTDEQVGPDVQRPIRGGNHRVVIDTAGSSPRIILRP